MYKLVDIVVPTQAQKKDLLPSITVNQVSQGVKVHPTALNILQSSFLLGILGRPGSGKSTVVEHMITNEKFYANKFERILYIGPSQYKKISHTYPIIQDEFNCRRTLDTKWIFDKISESNQWGCQNMLLVFDDVISNMKQNSQIRQLSQLFFNRRHLLTNGCISIIVTSQKWTSFPKFVRSVMTSLVSFGITKYQAQSVWKQTSMTISRNNFSFLISHLKPYEYLYINFANGRIFNSQWQQTN